MTVREIYEQNISQLPAVDRLRLAAFILDDLAATSGAGLDIRDDWNDQDVADLAAYSMKQATRAVPAEDADA